MARQKKDDLIELPSPNYTHGLDYKWKSFFLIPQQLSDDERMRAGIFIFSLFLFLSMELEEEARSQDLPTTTQWSINAIDNSSSFAYAGMWRPVMLPRPHCFRRAIHAENTEPISILLGSCSWRQPSNQSIPSLYGPFVRPFFGGLEFFFSLFLWMGAGNDLGRLLDGESNRLERPLL